MLMFKKEKKTLNAITLAARNAKLKYKYYHNKFWENVLSSKCQVLVSPFLSFSSVIWKYYRASMWEWYNYNPNFELASRHIKTNDNLTEHWHMDIIMQLNEEEVQ